jgi:hypothetical protein
MPSHDEHKSSAEIEREIETQRSRVSSTIDEIQEQLSPGQLVDQFMSMTKSGGGDFAKNLGHAISSNPLPVALLGASLVWLMSGAGSHNQQKPAARSEPSMGYRPGDSDALRAEAFEGYRGDQRSPLDRAKAFGDDVAGAVSGVADQVGGTIGETVEGLSETAGQMGSAIAGAGDQVRRTLHDVRDQASMATTSVTRMLENQPLVAGALAFAAGAALGAIVPRLPQENELMGEAADQVKDAVKDATAPIVEEGQHLLDEGMAKLDEGRHALEDGLSGAKDELDKALGNGQSQGRM